MVPTTPPVARRSVFLIGGYEPKSPEAFFQRTRRELGRFCHTWEATADMGQQSLSADGKLATAEVNSHVRGHHVETHINFMVWNDIVLSDFSRPTVVRVLRYLTTFADYLVTGTFLRMARQAWRFALYFLYPACMLILFAGLAGLIGLAAGQLPLPHVVEVARPVVGLAVGGLAFFGMLRWSGRRWFVLHLMDLWSFSRNHLRDRRPDIEQHIARFAAAIVDRARLAVDDEIVLVGHSTGGALILEIAAEALALEPDLGKTGPRVSVLTVGSTALKIGLHPAAHRFRQRVQRLVDAEAVTWIECQAHTDVINFYKTDPVAAMHLASSRAEAVPQVHVVRVRDMLQPEIYRRFRYNLFRVHYQFIMANTQRYAYDFFMMCCGERMLSEMLGESLRYRPILRLPGTLNHDC